MFHVLSLQVQTAKTDLLARRNGTTDKPGNVGTTTQSAIETSMMSRHSSSYAWLDYHWPLPPQLMHTPVPLQVLQLLSPDPRNRPVPLHVLQRPEPRQGVQTELELPPYELLYEESPLGTAHPAKIKSTNRVMTSNRIGNLRETEQTY